MYSGRSKTITVKAHPKYLGHTDIEDYRYYKKHVRNGKSTFDPIYQDCSDWILNRMSELKHNIQEHYSGDFEGEDTSEKFIQWNLVLKGRDKYLDSEFSHRFYDFLGLLKSLYKFTSLIYPIPSHSASENNCF